MVGDACELWLVMLICPWSRRCYAWESGKFVGLVMWTPETRLQAPRSIGLLLQLARWLLGDVTVKGCPRTSLSLAISAIKLVENSS